ncbi:hypothetical protein EV44_g3352 [Erysiphe necator]|uniref:Microbial-type PARG catalytic domain-containing protein n=1 Tax=Uncinula necator TaxID=52586 RepID=A0A0B1P1X6_UNCNE|nr:hypothetical protein EV44_g3352 [Erysiphe necator]
MPKTKSKGAMIAIEAKTTYIPHIQTHFSKLWPPTSHLCYSESIIAPPPTRHLHCRFGSANLIYEAFYEKDPIDLALDWVDPDGSAPIPVIMPANEKRPGGDWENSVMLPEECLCRRSNLSVTLATPALGNAAKMVFRSGPDRYEVWNRYRALPIISVSPPRRPKLDSSGKKYSFAQERDMMREKIHIALRIAVWYKHTRLCIGTFGLGNGFGNPTEEVAMLWREALMYNPEFIGHFQDIVFAFESPEGSAANEHPSYRAASSSRSRAVNQSRSNCASDLEVFRRIFKPSNIHNAFNQ